MPRQKINAPLAENPALKGNHKFHRQRCRALITKKQSYCDKPVIPGQRVCAGHGGLSTGPSTMEGLQRLAANKLVHGRETRALRFLRSQISHELRQKEEEMYSLGLIHGPRTRGRKPSLWAQAGLSQKFRAEVDTENSPYLSLIP